MDLESECSALESVEENEVVTPEILPNGSETKSENNINNNNNGSPHHEQVDADAKAGTAKVAEPANSPSQSPCGSTDSSPTVGPVKGYGLKKWRRIRREVNHEGVSNIDSSKILKRGLSNSQPNSRKPTISTTEMRQKSEGSVSSTNALLKSPVTLIDEFSIHGENGLIMGPIFAAGTDSENSEDRSSKSSTAASAPRMRYEVPSMAGFAREKGNKMKNLGGKNLGNSVQQVHQKGRIETSKKAKGDRVKIEKENSYSSIESDSRSSNFVFMQGFNSVNSNGIQQSGGRSVNYEGENSDEAQGYFRKNVSQENLVGGSSWEIKEEKSENGGSSVDRDPLLDYILNLQSVQEELEKEVNKLRDIGKEDTSLFDDSAKSATLPSDFAASGSGENVSLDSEVIFLNKNINVLKNKLDETRATLETKEAKVIELEAALNRSSSKLQKKETTGLTDAELEELFKQKIEAEVEYLAISRATKESLNKFENGEKKTTMMKNSGDIVVGRDEIMKMKRRVIKFSWYFLIQLLFLVLVFGVVALRLSPHSAEVVPT